MVNGLDLTVCLGIQPCLWMGKNGPSRAQKPSKSSHLKHTSKKPRCHSKPSNTNIGIQETNKRPTKTSKLIKKNIKHQPNSIKQQLLTILKYRRIHQDPNVYFVFQDLPKLAAKLAMHDGFSRCKQFAFFETENQWNISIISYQPVHIAYWYVSF